MATLDSIATLLQDLSVRLKNVEAKVGAGGGGGGGAAPAPAVSAPKSVGPTLSFAPEFDAAAKAFDEATREMGKKSIKAAKNMAKIIEFNKDLLAKTSTCAAPTDEQKKTLAAQLQKFVRLGEKARLPTRNHEKALHELFLAFFALLHDNPTETAKNQFESMQFHTNRILVEFKGKAEGDNHRKWVKATEDLLTFYKKFCMMECRRGLKFKGTGDVTAAASAPAASAGPPPPGAGAGPPPPPPSSAGPPPPPPPASTSKPAKAKGGGMGALFASIRGIDQSSGRTKGLKRVKDKDRSCKNRDLVKSSKVSAEDIEKRKKKNASKSKKKTGAKPKKVQPPKQYYAAGQRCHYVEHQPEGANITVEITAPTQAVYLYKCGKCNVNIKGKFKSLAIVNCEKTKVGFEDLISVAEVNNCKSVKLHSYGQCPSVTIDKTDGCYVYLSEKSLDCNFTCAKISEVNVAWPDPESEDKEMPDWIDKPIPEQYKHTIDLKRKVVTADVSDLYSEC